MMPISKISHMPMLIKLLVSMFTVCSKVSFPPKGLSLYHCIIFALCFVLSPGIFLRPPQNPAALARQRLAAVIHRPFTGFLKPAPNRHFLPSVCLFPLFTRGGRVSFRPSPTSRQEIKKGCGRIPSAAFVYRRPSFTPAGSGKHALRHGDGGARRSRPARRGCGRRSSCPRPPARPGPAPAQRLPPGPQPR